MDTLNMPLPYTEEEVKLLTQGPTAKLEVPHMPGATGLDATGVDFVAPTGAHEVMEAAGDALEAAREASAAAEAARAEAESKRMLATQLKSTKRDAHVWATVVRRAKEEQSEQQSEELKAKLLAAGEHRARQERVHIVQPEELELLQVEEGGSHQEQWRSAAERGVEDLVKRARQAGEVAGLEGAPEVDPLPVAEIEEEATSEELQRLAAEGREVVSMHARNHAQLVSSALEQASDSVGNNAVDEAVDYAARVNAHVQEVAQQQVEAIEKA